MSTFDARFAELQAKLSAVVQMLITEYPDAAVRAREVIDGAVAAAEVEDTVQADEARANAIGSLIVQARQALATVAPDPVPEPEPLPTPEPSEGEV